MRIPSIGGRYLPQFPNIPWVATGFYIVMKIGEDKSCGFLFSYDFVQSDQRIVFCPRYRSLLTLEHETLYTRPICYLPWTPPHIPLFSTISFHIVFFFNYVFYGSFNPRLLPRDYIDNGRVRIYEKPYVFSYRFIYIF